MVDKLIAPLGTNINLYTVCKPEKIYFSRHILQLLFQISIPENE